MPNSILFVDPSVTTANGIVVDGVAYGLIGPTNVTASTSSIDGECSDCEDCPPVPCSDPGDLCASYTVNFTFHNPGNPPDDGNYVGTITGSWYTWLGSASQIGGTNVLNIDLTVDFEVVDGVETCTWAMGMAGPRWGRIIRSAATLGRHAGGRVARWRPIVRRHLLHGRLAHLCGVN